jgi:hypothetical protein
MKHVPVLRHPDLFEGEGRCVVIQRDQERDLVQLIRIMLIEIVTTTSGSVANEEDGNDKDYT